LEFVWSLVPSNIKKYGKMTSKKTRLVRVPAYVYAELKDIIKSHKQIGINLTTAQAWEIYKTNNTPKKLKWDLI
jgi:hypothetical protein